ncbi:MMPL family transporter [Corynebacterium glutamicum]|uniref:MMPL family transporter n=1 Tax=Corynebacterium glutamicum TaxID=1718 RepID=UPI000942DE75|nr:MMPL family transporter [Corynebacterium glutamicum]OKX85573.1 multidrug RND transporter [Corynebacterium glutamicum]QDQ20450.1 MMPL family transporter [Corynebacterium glutamicum]QDQ24016.1 MMPL family transporter [Corynebacterium glutamicum]QDX75140.1 multidrug RND transporter [Corynebacterium glutamicum]QDX77904.1 multidrug RND transporter [Corynebacterium glutamicum]
MAKFLYKLGSTAYQKKWPFLAVWLVILIGITTLAGLYAKPTSSSFSIPGLDSVTTMEKMQERFPGSDDATSAPTGSVVIQAPEGKTLTDPEVEAEINQMLDEVRATGVLKDADSVVDPVLAAQGVAAQMTPALEAQGVPAEKIAADIESISPLSADETTGIISMTFDADSAMDVSAEDREKVTNILDEYDDGDLTVVYNGNVFGAAATSLDMTSELIGLLVAAVVLIVTFGSFIAAGMPLISAIIGVGIGIMGIQLATAFTDSVNDMTPTLASMIGLAVGIDYALFIVSRFRNELISQTGANDLEPKELAERLRTMPLAARAHAMGMAVGTAGSAVVFAGTTVLIALVALSIINIPFLTVMAIAAAITVAIAVLVALSFLPALLGLLGTRIFAARVPGPKVPDPEDEKPTMGLKWVRLVRKMPVAYLLVGVVLLGAIAIPATNMRLAMPTDGTSTLGTAPRTAYDMTADAFGPGRNAPMIALIDATDVPEEERPLVFGQAVEQFLNTDGVKNAQITQTTENFDTAQILITPEFDAIDERTSETLATLRADAETFADDTGATYGITGVTPIYDDISARLGDVLVPYVLIVLVLAFLVLLLVFRSIWVPLIAALGFGLSVLATFGATVAIFQEGAFGIIDDPQPLLSFLPIMLIGLVFGLAMDYQIFLVTRMREGFTKGKTAGNATSNGFKHGARVVTAAALIMVSVFAAFIAQDMAFIKTMGFALAVAVFFDAFVVRMMIIPATMFLLDDKAWWLPKWLDKILPNVDVEGEGLSELHEARTEELKENVGVGA